MALETSPIAVRARWVFPVAGPPIAGGVVTNCGRRIVSVGSSTDAAAVHDLGDVAILPGLVNAHTHLEFGSLDHPIGRAGMPLPDWIRQVIEYRSASASSATAAIERGLTESLANGTTALGEIATFDWRPVSGVAAGSTGRSRLPPNQVVPGDVVSTKPHVTMFHESIAPTADRIPVALAAAEAFARGHCSDGWIAPALSPHAPYTVHANLLTALVAIAERHHVPMAMHLAESREELELLRTSGGPFRDLLIGVGAWDPSRDARHASILDYLQQLSQAPRVLVIHGNYLSSLELDYLAARAQDMTVVFCPRTHDFFRHEQYPLREMLVRGVSVALGTDSRASNPDLSLFEEMRFVVARHPRLPPARVLELGTLAGAKSLGLADQMGTLEIGKLANLAIVSLGDVQSHDPHELLFDSAAHVVQTWVQGRVTSAVL